MKNDYKLDVGRNIDKRYEENRYILDLNKENGIIIAGYAGSGKTNLINYFKSQLLNKDCEIYQLSDRIGSYDKILLEDYSDKFFIDESINRIRFLELHMEAINRRINSLEEDDYKDVFIIIDDLSVNLLSLKLSNRDEYDKYINLLNYILDEGNKVGYKLILCGYRCKNSDIPITLSNDISCRISFSNPLEDFLEWGLLDDDGKLPKKVGELLINSKSYNFNNFLIKSYVV